MKTEHSTSKRKPAGTPAQLRQYDCGPVQLAGEKNALYERHLTFDQVIPVRLATSRNKFEAIARSIRDVLSQRYVMINGHHEPLTFRVQEGGPGSWQRVVDTTLPSPEDFAEPGHEPGLESLDYQVGPRSVVLLAESRGGGS